MFEVGRLPGEYGFGAVVTGLTVDDLDDLVSAKRCMIYGSTRASSFSSMSKVDVTRSCG